MLDNLGLAELAQKVRDALGARRHYKAPGKLPCDWDDSTAREELVDDLVCDCLDALSALEGEELIGRAKEERSSWPSWPTRTHRKVTTGSSGSQRKWRVTG